MDVLGWLLRTGPKDVRFWKQIALHSGRAVVLAFFALSCSSSPDPSAKTPEDLSAKASQPCLGPRSPAVTVTVRDARTGEPPRQPVTLVVSDGPEHRITYIDSVTIDFGERNTSNGVLTVGVHRPGMYLVKVRAKGYRPWLRDPVAVPDTACMAAGAGLQATLEPAIPAAPPTPAAQALVGDWHAYAERTMVMLKLKAQGDSVYGWGTIGHGSGFDGFTLPVIAKGVVRDRGVSIVLQTVDGLRHLLPQHQLTARITRDSVWNAQLAGPTTGDRTLRWRPCPTGPDACAYLTPLHRTVEVDTLAGGLFQ